MAKKPMKKHPPSPPPSLYYSSSDEKSPPPSISTSKKRSAGSTAAVLQKHAKPSLKPAVSRNPYYASELNLEKPLAAEAKTLGTGVRVKEEELLEGEEEESTDEEASEKREENEQQVSKTSSSSDSGSDGNGENRIADPSLKRSSCSKSVDGEEEGGEGFENEEEEEEESTADESSEDLRNKAPKENPPPKLGDSQNRDDDKQASKTSSSSDSGLGNEEEDIETPISEPSLEPLSNNPSVDSSAQPVEKEGNSGKQFAASPAQISKKKKKTSGRVGAKGGQEKELFKRIWSNEDELVLLHGVLEYKERHHFIPYSHVHAESLLKSVKDSLSISVSVNQINDKVRRMKRRYNNTTMRQNLAKKSKFSYPHNAVVFDLSKKIWNSFKGESIFPKNKITLEKKEEDINMKKGELKHFSEEYPSLYWLLKSEHVNDALVLQNHIPITNAKKLEEKCKELEMRDTELNMQKIEFLSSAVKLIKDTLAKC